MLFLALIAVVAVWILPEWFLLIVGYLGVRLLEGLLATDPIVSIGEADLLISDLVIAAVFLKLFIRGLIEPRLYRFGQGAFLPGMIAFVVAMVLSTLIAGAQYGEEVLERETVSLLRFLCLQVGGLVLLAMSLRTHRDVQAASRAVSWVGILTAVSIYVGLLLDSIGIRVGEVNVYDDFSRYQGLLGDSVKLFLLPFVFQEVLLGRFGRAAFFMIALLATGGRVGLAGFVAGLVAILAIEGSRILRQRKTVVFVAVTICLGVGLWMDVGGMATRLSDPAEVGEGTGRRIATWAVALDMAKDHYIAGTGFGGYALLMDAYEAPFQLVYFPFTFDTFSQLLKPVVDGGIPGLVAFCWMMWNILSIMKNSVEVSRGELQVFLRAGYVFALALVLISPLETWLLPASKVSHLLFMFLGIGLRVAALSAKEARGRTRRWPVLQPSLPDRKTLGFP